MTKVDVLVALQDDLENPGGLKSGEFLEAHVLDTIRRALASGDREGVVLALREWIALRREPETMLAVTAAKKEGIWELRDDIQAFRMEVDAGHVFPRFYLRWIDDALGVLSSL